MNMQLKITRLDDDMSDIGRLWRSVECVMEVTIGCLFRSGQNVHDCQEDGESVYLRSGYKNYGV